jgi:hypothetical protein
MAGQSGVYVSGGGGRASGRPKEKTAPELRGVVTQGKPVDSLSDPSYETPYCQLSPNFLSSIKLSSSGQA